MERVDAKGRKWGGVGCRKRTRGACAYLLACLMVRVVARQHQEIRGGREGGRVGTRRRQINLLSPPFSSSILPSDSLDSASRCLHILNNTIYSNSTVYLRTVPYMKHNNRMSLKCSCFGIPFGCISSYLACLPPVFQPPPLSYRNGMIALFFSYILYESLHPPIPCTTLPPTARRGRGGERETNEDK